MQGHACIFRPIIDFKDDHYMLRVPQEIPRRYIF